MNKGPFMAEGAARETLYQSKGGFNFNRFVNEALQPRVSQDTIKQLSAIQEYEEQFPDVSYYQGDIQWQVFQQLARAVIIRGGQGVWEDPKFRTNYTQARQHGLKRGIYWFYDDRYSPQQQFAALAKLLDQMGLPEMEIWIDWERTYGGQQGGLRNVVALMQLIEKEYAVTVGMYTGYYWFVENTNAITHLSQYMYLKNKPLWLAWYVNDVAKVKIPLPWTKMRHWQFGTPILGELYGVGTKEIDMNLDTEPVFTWQERYGDVMAIVVNKVGVVKPGVVAKVWSTVGGPRTYPDLTAGTAVRVDSIQGLYAHLTSPRSDWTKTEWLSLSDVVPPPPPPPVPEPPTTLPDLVITEHYEAEGYEPQIVIVTLKPRQ